MKKLTLSLCALIALTALWILLPIPFPFPGGRADVIISTITEVYDSDFSNLKLISQTRFLRENCFIFFARKPSQNQLKSIQQHSTRLSTFNVDTPESAEISENEVRRIKALLQAEDFDTTDISVESIYIDYDTFLGTNLYWIAGKQKLSLIAQDW